MKKIVAQHRKELLLFAFIGLLIQVMTIFTLWNIGFISEKLQQKDQSQFWVAIYIQATVFLFWVILHISNQFFKNYLYRKLVVKTQKYFLVNIENSKNKNNTLQVGKNSSLILKSIPEIIEKRVFSFIDVINNFLRFLIIIGLIAFYFWGLALIALASSLLLLLVSVFLTKKLMKVENKAQKNTLKYDQKFNQLINFFQRFFFVNKIINLAFLLNKNNQQFIKKQENLRNKHNNLLFPIIFLNIAFQVVMFLAAGFFYISDFIPLQILVSVIMFFGSLTDSLLNSIDTFSNYRAFQLVFNELMPKEIKAHKLKKLTIATLVFKDFNVNFENKKLFKTNFDYRFENGQNYLIVGPSGVGKSSIFRTIFDDDLSYNGQILINNKSLKTFNKKDLFAQMAFIESDSHIFSDTVLNNITLFENFSQEKIARVLSDVKLNKTFLQKEASTLSVGEKQRVALASFLIREPKWIIFDEGLSNLDKQTMNQVLFNLQKRKINIIHISHIRAIAKETYDQKIDFSA